MPYAFPLGEVNGKPVAYSREARRVERELPMNAPLHVRYLGSEGTLTVPTRDDWPIARMLSAGFSLLLVLVTWGMALFGARLSLLWLVLSLFAADLVKPLGWPGDWPGVPYGAWLDGLLVVLLAAGPVALGEMISNSRLRGALRVLGAVVLVHLSAAVLLPNDWVSPWVVALRFSFLPVFMLGFGQTLFIAGLVIGWRQLRSRA